MRHAYLLVAVIAVALSSASRTDAQERARGDSAPRWTSRFSGDTVWTESSKGAVRYVERGDTIWVTVRRRAEPERTTRWLVTGALATTTGPRGTVTRPVAQLRSFRKVALDMERMGARLESLPRRPSGRP